MVKAIMHGCNGHMGRVITDIIKNTEGIELVAGLINIPKYQMTIRYLKASMHVTWRPM